MAKNLVHFALALSISLGDPIILTFPLVIRLFCSISYHVGDNHVFYPAKIAESGLFQGHMTKIEFCFPFLKFCLFCSRAYHFRGEQK